MHPSRHRTPDRKGGGAHVLAVCCLPASHLENLTVEVPSRRSAAALASSLRTERSARAAMSEYCR